MRFSPLFLLAVGLQVFCCVSHAPAGIHSLLQRVAAEPAQKPHPAIVRIEVREPGAISHGSGSLIGIDDTYGWVITNWHVVRGATEDVTVSFPNGYESPGVVMKTDEDWDLALLAIYRPCVAPLPMAAEIPAPGDPLFIAGYGQGKFRLVRGDCVGYAAPETGFPQEMIDVSVPARQGDSGGPIVNENGQLAGVLFGSGGGLTTGTHVGRLRQFLAEVSVSVPTSSPMNDDGERALAGQQMTSHRQPEVGPPAGGDNPPPPEDALPSMPPVHLTTGNATPAAEASPAAAEIAAAPPTSIPAEYEELQALEVGWLGGSQGPWSETQAFFVFIAAIGLILFLSPRRPSPD